MLAGHRRSRPWHGSLGRAGGRAPRAALAAAVAAFVTHAGPAWADGAGAAEVEVRGERTTASRDATSASTVVVGDALRAPGTSSADVLSRVPGVEVTRTGSSSDLATAAIRGATSAQTPVYLAGVRLNDDVSGAADLSTLPLFLIERVEVYRGNAPLEADRLGIGGAVFFEPRFPASTEIGAGGSLGSFGQRGLWATGAARGDASAALVAVRRDVGDQDFTFQADDGGTRRRKNADFGATDAWAIARHRLGRGARITTLVHAYDREQGSPGTAVIENEGARTRTRRLLGAVSARVPCGRDDAGSESCSLELVTSALTSTLVLTDPSMTLAGAPLVSTAGTRVEEQARVTLRASDAFTLGGSLVEAVEHVDGNRPGDATVRAERVTTRPAATATWQAGPSTTLVGLGSVECHATSGTGGARGACPSLEPGARLGVVHRLSTGLEARANVGHYVRAPALGELYGVSAVVRGNPTLASEAGNSVDLGVRATARPRSMRADLDVFGFARQVSDLIAYRQNVLGITVPFNVGSARILGAEAAASLDWAAGLRGSVATTLMDARDTTASRGVSNDLLPLRSRLALTTGAEAYAPGGFPALSLDRAALGARVTYRSSRYADQAGLVVLPEQAVVDLEASLGFLRSALGARLALRNVFDTREVDTVGMPLPGRSVYGSLEAFWR